MPRQTPVHCAAIDLGATSGRVIVGSWNGKRLGLTEVYRFPNAFESVAGHEYWNLPGIWREIQRGLVEARRRFPRLASVGIDTWGVDHVLVNDVGRIVFPTHAYRDLRTQAFSDKLGRTRGALARIYSETGIPNVLFNTSLQLEETLAACPAVADLATRCLLLPDYFNFLLTGRMQNEISAASTTQLLDVNSEDWSRPALDYFHIPPEWFSQPARAGRRLGPVRIPELKGVQSVSVPGHDTACAYSAMPALPRRSLAEAGDADSREFFISCGTWSLAGFESDRPLLGPEAMAAGVANERTGDGAYRPLKGLVGLWLLERTLADCGARPRHARDWEALISAAARTPRPGLLLDISDPHFVNPPSMRDAVDAQLKRRRAKKPLTHAHYVRLICESLGAAHAEVMRTFETLSVSRRFTRILLVGGGAKNRLLCQATADAAGVPVHAYTLEATAVGNLGSQLVALGEIRDTKTFRRHLASQFTPRIYQPD